MLTLTLTEGRMLSDSHCTYTKTTTTTFNALQVNMTLVSSDLRHTGDDATYAKIKLCPNGA